MKFDPVGISYDAEDEFECWCPDSYRLVFLSIPECPRHGDAAKARRSLPSPNTETRTQQ